MIKNLQLWRDGWLRQFADGKVLRPKRDPGVTVRSGDRLYWLVGSSELGAWCASAVHALARAGVTPRFVVAVEAPGSFSVLDPRPGVVSGVSWEPPSLHLASLPAPFYLDSGFELAKCQLHLGELRGVLLEDWSRLKGVRKAARDLHVAGDGGECVECLCSVDPCGVHVVC